MSYDFAARGAVRHLCDLGFDAAEIEKRLSYPLPLSRIEEELAIYRKEKEAPEASWDYEKTTDAYGRTSFRRVRKD
ncbi:MAG: hypothetical protein IK115_10860 [Lachnospiraceae bacterium]|nr:hypothetical protein [Lachnospiraceae bacterium]